MENYKMINNVMTRSEVNKYLREGKIIYLALIDDEKNEISVVTSYGNDSKVESYYTCHGILASRLKELIICESLYPCYAFKMTTAENHYLAEIDIEADAQDIQQFSWVINDLVKVKPGEPWKTIDGRRVHYEVYISKEKEILPISEAL